MKTFALAMTAAAASAWSTNYTLTVDDAIQFTEGLVEAALGKECPDVTTCLTDLNTLASNVETAFHDFEQETFSGVKNGIEMMGTIAESISNDLQNCEAIEPEFQQLIEMAKQFKSPWSFAYHVGKDLLVNGVEIYHDIDGAVTAYNAKQYKTFGTDVGDALHAVFVGDASNGFDDDCSVPTGVEFGAACRMRELCGTGCAENMCVWTWPAGSSMDDEDTKCGCQQCNAELLQ